LCAIAPGLRSGRRAIFGRDMRPGVNRFSYPFISLGSARRLLAYNALLGLGILHSTVATRQHVALDARASVALGGAVALAYLAALCSAGPAPGIKRAGHPGL